MGDYNSSPDFADAFKDLRSRIEQLERRALIAPIVTTAQRPTPSASNKGAIIFNPTTGFFEGSTGAAWTTLG